MIKLNVEKKEWLNCFQNGVLSISKYYGKDIALAFSRYWGFCFDFNNECKSAERIGDYIDLGVPTWDEDLEKYHGIKINEVNKNDVLNFKKYIKEKMYNNIPVLIKVDGYFCPWYKNYNKLHAPHCTIIVDYDEINDVAYFNDYDLKNNNPLKLPVEIIENNYSSVFELNFKDSSIKVNPINVLLDMVNQIDFLDSINKLNKFKQLIENDFELNNVSSCKEYDRDYKEMFWMKLKATQCERRVASMVIEYLANLINSNKLYEVYNDFVELYDIWGDLRNNFIKLDFGRNVKYEQYIIELLNIIIHKENKVYLLLKQVIYDNRYQLEFLCEGGYKVLKIDDEKSVYCENDIYSNKDNKVDTLQAWCARESMLHELNRSVNIEFTNLFFTNLLLLIRYKDKNDFIDIKVVYIDGTTSNIIIDVGLSGYMISFDDNNEKIYIVSKIVTRSKKIKNINISSNTSVNAIAFL